MLERERERERERFWELETTMHSFSLRLFTILCVSYILPIVGELALLGKISGKIESCDG